MSNSHKMVCTPCDEGRKRRKICPQITSVWYNYMKDSIKSE